MQFLAECPVVLRQEVAPGHYRLGVRALEIAQSAAPGQFAMLEVARGLCPFLRRPMSFERIFPDGVAFLFKVEGEGTQMLSELTQGQTISVQGPLGNGFPLDPDFERHIIVAGGIGVAPFPALAEALIRICGKAPEVVVAARTKDLLLCEQDFRVMGCAVHLASDDGTAGEKALATDVLERLTPGPGTRVYACGPMPMMVAVSKMAEKRGFDCQASLETQMACGEGACLGCVVEANAEKEGEKMLRVCADGPVFDSRLIAWEAHNLAYDR